MQAKWSSPENQHPCLQGGPSRGELGIILAQALEERPHAIDVSRPVGVEYDHIVEVGHHLFQALYNLVGILDKPPG